MTRDEMRDWRVQDVAKDIVETHAQATPRDWGSPDHALYKLIVAKLVAERDRIAALRSRPAPDEDESDKAKHTRDSQPRFSQYEMDAATKPLHAEIERLRSRPAPPDDLVTKLRKRAQELALYAFREHGDDATLYNALADMGGVSPDGSGWLPTLDVGMTEVLAAPAQVAAPAPETPAPDAMPEILPTDLCGLDNGYVNGYDARRCPDRVTSIMRNGVVIWRRQEAHA